jgi:hypothetical protein
MAQGAGGDEMKSVKDYFESSGADHCQLQAPAESSVASRHTHEGQSVAKTDTTPADLIPALCVAYARLSTQLAKVAHRTAGLRQSNVYGTVTALKRWLACA